MFVFHKNVFFRIPFRISVIRRYQPPQCYLLCKTHSLGDISEKLIVVSFVSCNVYNRPVDFMDF